MAGSKASECRDGIAGRRSVWFERLSPAMAWPVAIGCGGVVWILTIGTDWLAFFRYVPGHLMIAINTLVALAYVFLIHELIAIGKALHAAHLRRLEIIAEMNHHIRNSLEAIQMAVHVPRNDHAAAEIDREVARIEWALREVLPRDAEDDAPMQEEPPA